MMCVCMTSGETKQKAPKTKNRLQQANGEMVSNLTTSHDHYLRAKSMSRLSPLVLMGALWKCQTPEVSGAEKADRASAWDQEG